MALYTLKAMKEEMDRQNSGIKYYCSQSKYRVFHFMIILSGAFVFISQNSIIWRCNNVSASVLFKQWPFKIGTTISEHIVDGVQNTLPQNTAPWHVEYFKLKEFTESRGRQVSLTAPSHSPLRLYLEERHLLISKTGILRRPETCRPCKVFPVDYI